jgi:hypothetical protein
VGCVHDALARGPAVAEEAHMKKLFWIAALALLVAGGCTRTVHGSGTSKDETRSVPAFDRVDMGGTGRLELTVGPAPSLSLHGDDNLLPLVKTTVKDGTLVIEDEKNLAPKVDLVLRATAPSLRGVEASGGVVVNVEGASGPELRLDASGGSTIDVDGRADRLVAKASGGATLALRDLATKEADVDASGGASIDLAVESRLGAEASGGAKVRYTGSPTVTKDSSGGASIGPR